MAKFHLKTLLIIPQVSQHTQVKNAGMRTSRLTSLCSDEYETRSDLRSASPVFCAVLRDSDKEGPALPELMVSH